MNEITITKAEYDDMKKAEIKHALLVDAIFAKAKESYNHKELTFGDIDDIMITLYPVTYAKRLREVTKAESEGKDDV